MNVFVNTRITILFPISLSFFMVWGRIVSIAMKLGCFEKDKLGQTKEYLKQNKYLIVILLLIGFLITNYIENY